MKLITVVDWVLEALRGFIGEDVPKVLIPLVNFAYYAISGFVFWGLYTTLGGTIYLVMMIISAIKALMLLIRALFRL